MGIFSLSPSFSFQMCCQKHSSVIWSAGNRAQEANPTRSLAIMPIISSAQKETGMPGVSLWFFMFKSMGVNRWIDETIEVNWGCRTGEMIPFPRPVSGFMVDADFELHKTILRAKCAFWQNMLLQRHLGLNGFNTPKQTYGALWQYDFWESEDC